VIGAPGALTSICSRSARYCHVENIIEEVKSSTARSVDIISEISFPGTPSAETNTIKYKRRAKHNIDALRRRPFNRPGMNIARGRQLTRIRNNGSMPTTMWVTIRFNISKMSIIDDKRNAISAAF
jgi:hypothetical protein